jgi:nitroreductase
MLDAIAARCSVRSYKTDPVSESDLSTILEAAFCAPSANNGRPWHIIVVTDADKRRALSTVHQWAGFCAQAPVVLAVCGDETISPHWWIEDCSAATENVLVQAAALGLGTCWIGIRGDREKGLEREDMVREVLGLPPHIRCLCLISLGYPASELRTKDPGGLEHVHREQW